MNRDRLYKNKISSYSEEKRVPKACLNGFYEGEDPSYGNDFSDMTGNASETKIRRVSGFIVSLQIMQKSQYRFFKLFSGFMIKEKSCSRDKR